MQTDGVSDPDLNETDRAILRELTTGRNAPSNIADSVGKSRQYVHQRMKLLETADYLTNLGSGVYELDPNELPDHVRDDLDIGGESEADLRAQLQGALETRDDAQARADRLADELEDCRERLEAAESETEADVEQARDALRRALEDDVWGPVEDAAHYLGVDR